MSTKFLTPLFLVSLLAFTVLQARAETEQELIATLQSNASMVEKCEACKKLRLVGTAKCVPVVAILLEDERISQAARYALEGIATPEGDAALREAVGKTSGLLKTGLIDSLGWRRDFAAVSLLKPLLADADVAIASSTARVLGRIGGKDALAALGAASKSAAPDVRPAVLEALMCCAEKLLADGKAGDAKRVYESLAKSSEAEHIRVAAHAGLIHCAGKGALDQVKSALQGNESAAQIAALQLAGDLRDSKVTKVFVELLPKSQPILQVALLALLRTRGDAAALAAVETAARSRDAAVRVAAFTALGELGDARAIPLLLEAATSGDTTEQRAARQALVALHGDDIAVALPTQLKKATPSGQMELAHILAARGEKTAVPALLQLARSDQRAPRQAALQALGSLVSGSHLDALVQLLAEAKADDARSEVISVFESLADRAGHQPPADFAPIVRGLASGNMETRKALLAISALFVDERLRNAFRLALKDSDERVRGAAARSLCKTRDAALLPDLLDVARRASDSSLRTLAIAGIVRLVTDEGAVFSASQRTETLTTACGLASRAEDKRQVLAGLARVPHAETLKLAEQACADAAVQAEAELACFQILQKLGGADSNTVKETLSRLAASAGNPSIRSNAQVLLKKLR